MNYINTLKEGDNLEIMRLLPSNTLDLIYCDILYATGRDFGDYQDLKLNKQIVYDFYIPRLTEMKRILKDTGSIYLQMDTRISHWLRCIMDDIFGMNNFKNEIRVRKRTNGNNVKTNYFVKNSDVILFYTKTKNYNFNIPYKPLSNATLNRYNIVVNGRFAKNVSIHKPTVSKQTQLVFKGKTYFGAYTWTQKTLDERIANGWIIGVNTLGNLTYLKFLDESKGVQIDDMWMNFTYENTRIDYKTQKPDTLLNFIIKASSNEGDLVGDFFMGSGITLAVAKNLKRNYFGCDINPNSLIVAKKIIEEYKQEGQVIKNELFDF